MSQFKPLPPIQELQQAFDYDPVTGIFRNKYRRGARALKGSLAGSVKGSTGYLFLSSQEEPDQRVKACLVFYDRCRSSRFTRRSYR